MIIITVLTLIGAFTGGVACGLILAESRQKASKQREMGGK